ITLVDHFPPQPIYDNGAWYEVFNGLFRRTTPARYDHSTLLDLRAETLQRHIEAMDFHSGYKASLDTYWHQHLSDYRLCCKLNFIAACNKQVAEGSLSDAARKLAWRAADLIPRGKGLRLSTLSIYGYAATDLLYINDTKTDLTLLYAPGNSSPLLEFASEDLLKDWVGQQCKGADTR
ncbi:dermonecrotic toxin domain-containing protein, partial [Pseudomonas kurunegalensis]|nr:mannosyltransferase [Pseudomonas kurunegalensis]